VRARRGGARGEKGGGRQAEDRHFVGQPDPLLRVPAVHDGQRPSHRAQGRGRAEGDGRRPGPVHRGVSQALRKTGGVTSFVEAARREKLAELVKRIGVEGPLFRTKTGEVTLRVQRLTLLTKSLRPLPLGKEDAEGKRHGELSDPELRARQRYADLAVHPDVRDVFRLRARATGYIRT